ncbi:MAG: hypothetical protein EBS05_24080 [Proteobacteria bacterium]|nr:hypothetical protein [Pseudomonadota bacterium]
MSAIDHFTHVGQPGLVLELFPGERWTPNTGAMLTEVFRGSEDEVLAEAAACRAAGLSYTIHPGLEGGVRCIEVTRPQPDTGFTLYLRDDLLGRDSEKDLIQDVSLQGVNQNALMVLATYMQNLDSIPNADARVQEYALSVAQLAARESTYSLPANTLVYPYLAHAAGVRSTPSPDWVIRRTAIYAPGAPVQPQFFTNVRCVYSTSSDLATKEVIDPNRIWDIPAGEWFKRSPSFSRQSNGTTVVTVEWWWAKSWMLIYPRATL